MHYRFPNVGADLRLTSPSARHQPTLQDHGYRRVYHVMCLFAPLAFARYSISLPIEGWLRLSRPRCLVQPRWFTHPKTVTHPGTVWARRRVTMLIETNVLPLNQTGKVP